MLDIILDTLIDTIKMLPFLFLSYLIIEFIEHKSSNKLSNTLSKSGKLGPFIGSLLGIVPQCGFSVTASNLYAGRVITLGTLISVFLTTSDEAIPVLLANPNSIGELIKIIIVKFIIGIIAGFTIDFIIRKKHTNKLREQNTNIQQEHIHSICKNCDCEHNGIFFPALQHTISTLIFILIVAFILNTAIHFIGEENLAKVLLSGSIFQPVIASLIGLIPNCASSVILTELYLSGSISFASIIAGLSTGAGLGLVVLFKANKNIKENLKILATMYFIGVLFGIIIEIIEVFI